MAIKPELFSSCITICTMEQEVENIENKFKSELYKRYNAGARHLIPKEKYFTTINDVKVAAAQRKDKSRYQYYILTRYEVLECGDVEKLIRRRKTPDDPIKYFITIEDTFDALKRAHIATGHGGRDRMRKSVSQKYDNIADTDIVLFKSYCSECQKKTKLPSTKGVAVRPILSSEFNSRAQIDLIDMQSAAHNSYKWILVYQDHLTKFVVIRALTSKRASEVAYHVLDIFLLLGSPSILQSDNGREFTAEVIQELKILWPELHLVHGRPRHPQSQGSVERANGDIKDMLVSWMNDNDTTDWSVGIKFVQFKKNTSLHAGIQRSPYSALFGNDARCGLSTSSLPVEILDRLLTENDVDLNNQVSLREAVSLASSSGGQGFVKCNCALCLPWHFSISGSQYPLTSQLAYFLLDSSANFAPSPHS